MRQEEQLNTYANAIGYYGCAPCCGALRRRPNTGWPW